MEIIKTCSPNLGCAELLPFLPSWDTNEVDEFVLLFDGDGLGIRLALIVAPPTNENIFCSDFFDVDRNPTILPDVTAGAEPDDLRDVADA